MCKKMLNCYIRDVARIVRCWGYPGGAKADTENGVLTEDPIAKVQPSGLDETKYRDRRERLR
jgi:hypothetical protein